jgi:hypothetical protein
MSIAVKKVNTYGYKMARKKQLVVNPIFDNLNRPGSGTLELGIQKKLRILTDLDPQHWSKVPWDGDLSLLSPLAAPFSVPLAAVVSSIFFPPLAYKKTMISLMLQS